MVKLENGPGVLLIVGLLLAAGSCSRPDPRGTRILLITIDTLRYDSFAGGTEGSSAMPLTAARARDCLVFDRFFAATSTTQPTHATLLTALHPWQHGVTRNGIVLDEKYLTVVEQLREAGFRTAAVVASMPVSRKFGFAQGFDEFHDDFSHILSPGAKGDIGRRYYSLAESVTETALEIVDRWAGTDRQFLWIHYFDPHAPYGDSGDGPTVRPMPLVERIVKGEVGRQRGIELAKRLYEQDVAYLDRSLERLFRRLEDDQDALETHVLFTADHGESFGEDDSMAHGRRLTAGQIHIPTFLCSPRAQAGADSGVAGSIDITPTILSLAGVSPRSPAGRDLTRPPPGRTRAFGMKSTRRYRELRLDGKVYDLSSDLFYMVDHDGTLYRGDAERLVEPPEGSRFDAAPLVDQLPAMFGSFETQLRRQSGDEITDPETLRALEALGYVQ